MAIEIEIARHHHERFDDAGYPDGLAREEIPLAAHIVALADTPMHFRNKIDSSPTVKLFEI
jgi:response regulator RpfG family c-di-GMP phosphodiesterase